MTEHDDRPSMKLPRLDELVDGINDVELAPGISTRFGLCKACEIVYPPASVHDCPSEGGTE